MKKILFITVFTAFAAGSFAQDYILFKNGEKITVTVLAVTDEYVRYYLFDDPGRKMYARDIDKISKIIFWNGEEVFWSEPEVQDRDGTEARKEEKFISPAGQNNRYPEKCSQSKNSEGESGMSSAQTGDFLFFKDGRRKTVIVLEITPELIKYRDFDNPSGPVFSIYKSDATKIILQNGATEIIASPESREYRHRDDRSQSHGNPSPPEREYSAPTKTTAAQSPYQPASVSGKRLRFGIRGGVNFSTFSGMQETFDLISEKADSLNYENVNKTGFHVGFASEINLLSNVLFLQSELLFSLQGAKRKEGENSSTDLYYLQLPVSLVYRINISSNAGIILGAGPYLAYGIYGKAFERKFEQSDYGFTFLGGFQFGKIRISGAYDFGMYEVSNAEKLEISPDINGVPELCTRNVKISLGYFF